jgi:hypothetical protein
MDFFPLGRRTSRTTRAYACVARTRACGQVVSNGLEVLMVE